MARRRRPKSRSEALLDLLPQAVGLIFLAVYFIPGAKEFFGGLLVVSIAIGVLAVIALVARAFIRRQNRGHQMPQIMTAAPTISAPPFAAAQAPAPAPAKAAVWTLETLRSLEWKRFEQLVRAYIRELGHQARLTRAGADGGVDIQVFDSATGQVLMVVQCKAWNAYPVSVKPVRELYGVMAAGKIPQCAFFTTGTFTSEALAFGREHDVDLVDGAEFLARINQLKPAQASGLYDEATSGDYTTPTCPSCDIKMTLRTAARGRSEGDDFWGCRNYPRCRQTFKCTAATAAVR